MPVRLAFAALAAALLAGCAHFECTAHGGREVRELKTEHFVVTSDLPPDEHRAEAERLELLWDTFAQFFRADVPSAAVPVVVMSDPEDVGAFAVGYSGFVRRSSGRVLVVGSKVKTGKTSTNAHELTHLVSAYMMPRQPRWIAEGLAAYFEDATFADARTVKMGNWNALRAEEAFVVGVAGLDELSEWGGPRNAGGEARLYASAWAWIHYLANHDEARLQRLFEGLRGVAPLQKVVSDVFPPADAERLRGEIAAYLGDARFRGWQTWLKRTPVVSAPRVLAPWEVHLLRSRLYLYEEPAPVLRELEAAVALAPAPHPAAVAVAEATLKKADLTALLAAYPDSPDVLLAIHEAGKPVPREALVAAAKRTDDAALLVAAAQASATHDADEAEALAKRSLELAPWSSAALVVQVQVDLRRSDCDAAELTTARLEATLADERSANNSKFLETTRQAIGKCRARPRK